MNIDTLKALVDKANENATEELVEMRNTALEMAHSRQYRTLLSIGADTKTKKSLGKGVMTGILYLAPAHVSGVNVCPASSEGCRAACLFYAGMGQVNGTTLARLRRTYEYLLSPELFAFRLSYEIGTLVRRAEGKNMLPAVRLNGTSDLPWENIYLPRFDHGDPKLNLFEQFPNLQFYDYTKRFQRLEKCQHIPNYHLTFSLAESRTSRVQAVKALEMGFNVTVVHEGSPETFMGYPTLDGDKHDIRFWDQKEGGPFVVLLKPKGIKARRDKTGFVVRNTPSGVKDKE